MEFYTNHNKTTLIVQSEIHSWCNELDEDANWDSLLPRSASDWKKRGFKLISRAEAIEVAEEIFDSAGYVFPGFGEGEGE
jgi:hypothetical protein